MDRLLTFLFIVALFGCCLAFGLGCTWAAHTIYPTTPGIMVFVLLVTGWSPILFVVQWLLTRHDHEHQRP